MAFGGWPAEAVEFYEGLEADNSKSYWTSHKAVYEDAVLRPMQELTELLAAEFGEPKIFRPYRDIRFSADKTPYKTHIGAVLGHTSYVQFSADLEAIIAELEKAGVEIHGHESLKSAPRGYPPDHPRIGLLRHKGLTTWQHWEPGSWLRESSAADRVTSFFRTSAAVCSWLTSNVGS